MKFRCSILIGVLTLALSASLGDASPLRTPVVRHLAVATPSIPPSIPASQTDVAAVPECEEVVTQDGGFRRVEPPERPVTISEPPRPWVLSDKTWRSIIESPVNIDVSLERGNEYFGVRIVLPFGS